MSVSNCLLPGHFVPFLDLSPARGLFALLDFWIGSFVFNPVLLFKPWQFFFFFFFSGVRDLDLLLGFCLSVILIKT